MNGVTPKIVQIDLAFLGDGTYKSLCVYDEKAGAVLVNLVRKRQTLGPKPGVRVDTTSVQRNDSLVLELVAGGGFAALFSQ
jgi:hypothetical protein